MPEKNMKKLTKLVGGFGLLGILYSSSGYSQTAIRNANGKIVNCVRYYEKDGIEYCVGEDGVTYQSAFPSYKGNKTNTSNLQNRNSNLGGEILTGAAVLGGLLLINELLKPRDTKRDHSNSNTNYYKPAEYNKSSATEEAKKESNFNNYFNTNTGETKEVFESPRKEWWKEKSETNQKWWGGSESDLENLAKKVTENLAKLLPGGEIVLKADEVYDLSNPDKTKENIKNIWNNEVEKANDFEEKYGGNMVLTHVEKDFNGYKLNVLEYKKLSDIEKSDLEKVIGYHTYQIIVDHTPVGPYVKTAVELQESEKSSGWWENRVRKADEFYKKYNQEMVYVYVEKDVKDVDGNNTGVQMRVLSHRKRLPNEEPTNFQKVIDYYTYKIVADYTPVGPYVKKAVELQDNEKNTDNKSWWEK